MICGAPRRFHCHGGPAPNRHGVDAAGDVSNAFSKFALLVFDPVEIRRHPCDDAAETRWRVAAMILFQLKVAAASALTAQGERADNT
jgi:hypothetical protein